MDLLARQQLRKSIASSNLALSFIDELKKYQKLLKENGREIRLMSPEALQRFSSESEQVQAVLLERLKKVNGLHDHLSSMDTDFKDTLQCLWRVFKNFDWLPDNDLFSRLQPGQVLEIYLPDQTQIFRTFNFFDYTSYSLSDLMVFPWYELFFHGMDHNVYAGVVQKIFGEHVPTSELFKLPTAQSAERFSPLEYQVQLESVFLKGIREKMSSQNSALVAVWDIKLVAKKDAVADPFDFYDDFI